MEANYRHIKVPGFGCTYPNDFRDDAGTCGLELRRVVRDEVLEQSNLSPMIVLPIEAGCGSIQVVGTAKFPLDYESLLVIPKSFGWSLATMTPILKVMLIEIHDQAFSSCADDFGLAREAVFEAFAKPRKVTRTTWVNELAHRYAFERSIARSSSSRAARFLESEMLKEIYYAVSRDSQVDHDVPFFIDLPEALRRALTFIEQNLHDNILADEIAAAAVTSKPTLVRLFRNHLNTSPVKYLWNRRLDEADRLLLTGRYTVSEVAALLAFSDSSSFSKSFVERFDARPSSRLPGS